MCFPKLISAESSDSAICNQHPQLSCWEWWAHLIHFQEMPNLNKHRPLWVLSCENYMPVNRWLVVTCDFSEDDHLVQWTDVCCKNLTHKTWKPQALKSTFVATNLLNSLVKDILSAFLLQVCAEGRHSGRGTVWMGYYEGFTSYVQDRDSENGKGSLVLDPPGQVNHTWNSTVLK